MNTTAMRSRWAAVGAAVAITLGAGGIGLVSATNPDGAVAYVPLDVPCRGADTRPGDDNVGDKASPIGPGETHTINSNDGDCDGLVPASATGLQLNVTSLNSTIPSFLTIWASGDRPTASSLNPTPGQPPVPNAVTTAITGTGDFNIFNNAGNVDVVVDIVGYYTNHNHDDRYYQKGEVDAAVGAKANSADVYTKTEVDSAVNPKNNVTVRSDVEETTSALDAGGADEVVASVTVPAVFGYFVVDADVVGFGVAASPLLRCSINQGATSTTLQTSNQAIVTIGTNQWETLSFTRTFANSLALVGQTETTFNLVCDASAANLIDNVNLTATHVDDFVGPFVIGS